MTHTPIMTQRLFPGRAAAARAIAALLCLAGAAGAEGTPAPVPPGAVIVGTIDGAIGPATTEYIGRLLREADGGSAACVVLRMDTPGGLSSSMRDIIQAILASPVPVVTYVAPEGAHAASAGALIALAAHVAAMAPGTNVGAAHPVSLGVGGEQTSDVMEEKVTNDAAAYARSLAARRGRNVEWAERVVRESVASTAEEAVAENVADVVAPTLSDLLARIDGRIVDLPGGADTLRVASATVIESPPTFRERFLARISDPNIAYLLMLVGVFGIIFELQNPGAVLPGVVGVLSLATAAFALQMLPLSWTGVALIAIAIAMFVLEVKVPSHGALTVGGVVAMTIGSIMLVDSPVPVMRVSLAVIIPSVLFTALFFIFAVGMGIRAQRRRVTTGNEGLLGEAGTARSDVHAGGTVFVHGEYWNAHSDTPIPAGSAIEVVGVEGMKLKVRPRAV